MKFSTERRITREIPMLFENTYSRNEENTHIVNTTYCQNTFEFHLDNSYPFSPPLSILCNGNKIECNKQPNGIHCFMCQNNLCSYWGPTITMQKIIQLYTHEYFHMCILVSQLFQCKLPRELVEYIAHFVISKQ